MTLITNKSQLPPKECKHGFPYSQLESIFDEQQYKRLCEWMAGQTCALCEGKECDKAHGATVYSWDLEGFLEGSPIFD